MYSWMEVLSKLEPGLVLALSLYSLFLFKKLRQKNFLYSFIMFIFGVLVVSLKQMHGAELSFHGIEIENINVLANLFISLWTLFLLGICKKIFNLKTNNEKLSKNMTALMFVVFFLAVFNFIPTIGDRTKDLMTLGFTIFSLFVCFTVSSYYKEIQSSTSMRYEAFCLLTTAAFVPMFLFNNYEITNYDKTFYYNFVLYLAPIIYSLSFFVLMTSLIENVKYLKLKKLKIQKIKQEQQKKVAEEKHFKEASEQAHRMKIVEQEKEMEANLLLKMAARGKAIQKIADKASAESESKSGFIGFLSHEIRTPLNGIMGMVRMLANTKLDGKQQEFINNLNYSGEALLSLLNDVLDYSKINSGHMEIENISFDIFKFIDNIGLTMVSRAEQQGIELTSEYDKKVPQFIKGDPTRLRQIMLNLIGNSIKFTKKGGVYVNLKTLRADGKKCKLRAEIRDTGIGIPESAKGKLFQEYVQADSSTSRNFGGTGLGLSICKKLVKAMGGEIGVISQEGKGSTFWWEVEFDIADKVEEETGSLDFVATQNKKSYDVLVVEDDQISQQIVGSYLTSNGQVPKFASDGESAIRMVTAGKIDFVFLDMGLPDMNGIEVCHFIRNNTEIEGLKDIPVIALTGNVSEKDQEKYISQGINFCLGKPVSPEDIQKALFEIFKLLPDEDAGEKGDKDSGKGSEAVKPVKENKEDKEDKDAEVEKRKPKKELHTVLIAEDDLMSQQILKGYLENDFHSVIAVPSGIEALELVKEKNIDVVLMDINMPGMNGLEATKKIRELKNAEKAQTPIIAITGNVSEEDIESCRKAGMNDFIGKPIDPDHLRGAIMRMANTGTTSSTFTSESVNRYLEKNQIPVPKHKIPVAVKIPVNQEAGNKDGLPYVLVIEDDLISQKIVSEYLISFEYNPIVAGSAEEGIGLINKNNFLAVLMDIDLPGMNGLDATREIRKMSDQIKANLPVIAITGNIKQKDVEACREAGMNDFIGKPINPNYLKGALERNRGSVENVNLEEDDLMKHLDTEVLNNLKKSFAPDVFQGLMAQFDVSAEEAQKSLMEAVADEGRDDIKSKAHLLKGMSRNIGLKIVGNFMEAIEKGAMTASLEDLKDMVVEADSVLEEGKAALNAWFEKWKSNV